MSVHIWLTSLVGLMQIYNHLFSVKEKEKGQKENTKVNCQTGLNKHYSPKITQLQIIISCCFYVLPIKVPEHLLNLHTITPHIGIHVVQRQVTRQ